MIILWTLLLISTTASHKIVESTEDIGPEEFINVTTLYPIAKNQTNTVKNNAITEKEITNYNTKDDKKEKPKTGATIWKLEAAFAESNLSKNEKEIETLSITDSKATTDKNMNCTKEFKPSLHLGNIIDEDSAEVTPRTTFGSFTPVIKKPATGFMSSPKDKLYANYNNIPKEIYETHVEYPYKFENNIFTKARDNWGPDLLEPKPTAEVPVKVPAGGLYKFPYSFKEKPSVTHDDFEMEFNGDGRVKENDVQKRVSPWQHLLQLVTAFIPVGLIISALTPSVITVHSTGNNNQYPSNIYRRSESGMMDMTPISERCRRRLLCELHSEINYTRSPSSAPRRGKQCYRIRCEDTQAMTRMLYWLISYRQPTGDQRARYFT